MRSPFATFPSPLRAALGVTLAGLAVAAPTTAASADDGPRVKYVVIGVSAERLVDRSLRDHARRTLVSRAVRLHARAADLRGAGVRRRALRAEMRGASIERLEGRVSTLRRRIRTLRRTGGAPAVPIPAALAAIAACESGGDPRAVSSGGQYRGKYQFDRRTWASVGGSGDPAAAPEVEQDRRAAMLHARAGASPWPVCGR